MNPMRRLAVKVGGLKWLPRFLPVIVRLDMFLRWVSRGHVTLLTFATLPELFLTVPGRKSGVERTTPLLCVPHGDGWLIAGSNWGGEKAPVWVLNVEAAETVKVEYRRRTTVCRPRRLEGDEREAAWAVMVDTWPNYNLYAQRTERQIKVFYLTPDGHPFPTA